MELGEFLSIINSNSPEDISKALEEVESKLNKLKDTEYKEWVDGIISLFYIDLIEHPEFEKVVDEAENILIKQGEKIFDILKKYFSDTDFKVTMRIANIIGKLGIKAIDFLGKVLEESNDNYEKSLALYSVGKIKDRRVKQLMPKVLKFLNDSDKEVRDTLARTIGKMVESIPREDFKDEEINEIFDALIKLSSDFYSSVRSKAIRSLGKMAKFGYLDRDKLEKSKKIVEAKLGKLPPYRWDDAYIVRKEAQEAIEYIKEKL